MPRLFFALSVAAINGGSLLLFTARSGSGLSPCVFSLLDGVSLRCGLITWAVICVFCRFATFFHPLTAFYICRGCRFAISYFLHITFLQDVFRLHRARWRFWRGSFLLRCERVSFPFSASCMPLFGRVLPYIPAAVLLRRCRPPSGIYAQNALLY